MRDVHGESRAQYAYYVLLVLDQNMRIQRQRENPAGRLLGHREVTGPVPQRAERRLQVDRNRIVELRLDAGRTQLGEQPITIWNAHDVQVPDVLVARRHPWGRHDRQIRDEIGVARGRAPAALVPFGEASELGPEHDGLQAVEP